MSSMRDGTNKQTSEDSATQLLIWETPSLAILWSQGWQPVEFDLILVPFQAVEVVPLSQRIPVMILWYYVIMLCYFHLHGHDHHHEHHKNHIKSHYFHNNDNNNNLINNSFTLLSSSSPPSTTPSTTSHYLQSNLAFSPLDLVCGTTTASCTSPCSPPTEIHQNQKIVLNPLKYINKLINCQNSPYCSPPTEIYQKLI